MPSQSNMITSPFPPTQLPSLSPSNPQSSPPRAPASLLSLPAPLLSYLFHSPRSQEPPELSTLPPSDSAPGPSTMEASWAISVSLFGGLQFFQGPPNPTRPWDPDHPPLTPPDLYGPMVWLPGPQILPLQLPALKQVLQSPASGPPPNPSRTPQMPSDTSSGGSVTVPFFPHALP